MRGCVVVAVLRYVTVNSMCHIKESVQYLLSFLPLFIHSSACSLLFLKIGMGAAARICVEDLAHDTKWIEYLADKFKKGRNV